MRGPEDASLLAVEVVDLTDGHRVAYGRAHVFPTLTMAFVDLDRPLTDGVYVLHFDRQVRRTVELKKSEGTDGRMAVSWTDGRPLLAGDQAD